MAQKSELTRSDGRSYVHRGFYDGGGVADTWSNTNVEEKVGLSAGGPTREGA